MFTFLCTYDKIWMSNSCIWLLTSYFLKNEPLSNENKIVVKDYQTPKVIKIYLKFYQIFSKLTIYELHVSKVLWFGHTELQRNS